MKEEYKNLSIEKKLFLYELRNPDYHLRKIKEIIENITFETCLDDEWKQKHYKILNSIMLSQRVVKQSKRKSNYKVEKLRRYSI